ncbi:MAG: SBBP repeat-containing protein [candidate division Zixibacteria bacterium]|nr:SBBP repeat-containing protein [candidate division Zixibacteria bacterium]
MFVTKVIFAFFLTFFFALPLFAQSVDTAWVRRYNGTANRNDKVTDLTVDGKDNIYITGYSDQDINETTNSDFLTIKYFPDGDTAWVRRYPGTADLDDYAEAIAVDEYGNVYVTGATGLGSDSGVYGDFVTIKYLPDGDTAWVRVFYGEEKDMNLSANAVEVDDSGYVYVTGTLMTLKYDSYGNCLWIRMYDFVGKDLKVDNFGNLYITGYKKESGAQYDYVSIKYNPDGDTVWVRTYNGPGNGDDKAYAIAVDRSGNVYVTGMSFGRGVSYDYATIKYYANGETDWVRRYNGLDNEWDQATSMVLDHSGNVYITGFSWGSETSHDYLTIKYRPNGDSVWTRRYNGFKNSSDRAWAITIDNSDNIFVTGYSPDSLTYGDYATIGYDSYGTKLWEKRYNGPGNSSDHASALSVDNSGNLYVSGWSSGNGTSFDYATLKYVQFIRGDVNEDGYLSVLDVICLIDYLFKSGPAPEPLQSGDINCSGRVSLSDIVYLISYLLKIGPLPCK